MDPTILASIIGSGTDLLSGLLSALSTGQKIRSAQRLLKPNIPYYNLAQSMPMFSSVLQKAVLGNLGQQFGSKTLGNWGIDIGKLIGQKYGW